MPTATSISPRGERALDLALLFGGGGTCEEGDAHFGHIPADEGKVLRGEHLGGRDHRRLIAALCGHVHAAQRDGRLAAADVPLQQPVHAVRPGAVRQNIGDRLVLPVGEGEGEAGDEGCHVLTQRSTVKARASPLAPLAAAEGGDEQKVLLERDALGRGGDILLRFGRVDAAVRLPQRHEAVPAGEGGREGGRWRAGGQRVAHGVAHGALGERALEPYTGTMPFKRTFLPRGSKEGLIMDGAPVPQRLLTRP